MKRSPTRLVLSIAGVLGALLLAGVLTLLLLDVAIPAPRADVAALGPAVQTIPDAAVTAMLVVQVRDLGQKPHDWDGDDSWLVFLDDAHRPVGHIGGAAMMQSRIAGAEGTLALAQPDSFQIISGHRPPITLPHPPDYAVAASSSVTGPDREAFLWTGYGPAHGLRIGPHHPPTRINRPGTVVATGYCGHDYYVATGSAGVGEYGEILLERASPGAEFVPVTSWGGSVPIDRGLPISCTGPSVRVPLHDGNSDRRASTDGHGPGLLGFREVDVNTGVSRWIPASTSIIDRRLAETLSVAGGSASSHVSADGTVTYLDPAGHLQ